MTYRQPVPGFILISRSMMKFGFEWHDAKAEANWRDQGVSFELAEMVFHDPFAVVCC